MFIKRRAKVGVRNRVNSGFTLVELIVIIVVISVVVAALLGVFTSGVRNSADPMLRMQAIAIAQGYLEEALLKEYADPQSETGTCEEGALPANRSSYDDAQDYACINDATGARDQFGNLIADLADYNVVVNVNTVTLGGAGQQANAREVIVMVTHDSLSAINVTLTGYRAQY